jgi:hypothetical protein
VLLYERTPKVIAITKGCCLICCLFQGFYQAWRELKVLEQ